MNVSQETGWNDNSQINSLAVIKQKCLTAEYHNQALQLNSKYMYLLKNECLYN